MGKITAAIIAGLFTFIAITAVYGVISFTSAPSTSKEVVIVDVPPGSSFSSVAKDMAMKGLIHNELAFKIYAKLLGYTTSLHVGEFEIRKNMSPAEILSQLASGKSVTYPITIPEGYNIFEITSVLEKQWPEKATEFLRLTKDPQFIQQILGNKLPSFEGYLFPDTYLISKYMSTKDIIKMMHKRFEEAYALLPKNEIAKSFTKNQIVTFASVIEKETGVAVERPLISSVFHNRLKKSMRLQSDPTIIYGVWVETGEYLKNIRRSDIRAPTPYNTYTIKALPIGPIANPGFESLRAVLEPVSSDYLYFVSKNDGTHVFSETLEKHNKAVRDYQLNRKAREGKSWRDQSKSTE